MACGGCNGKKNFIFVLKKQYQLIFFLVIQLRLTKKKITCQVKSNVKIRFEGYKFIGQSGILKIREKLDIELKSKAKIKL